MAGVALIALLGSTTQVCSLSSTGDGQHHFAEFMQFWDLVHKYPDCVIK